MTDRRDLKEVCFSIKDRKWKMTDRRDLKEVCFSIKDRKWKMTDRRDLKEVCFSIKDRKWKMTDLRDLKEVCFSIKDRKWKMTDRRDLKEVCFSIKDRKWKMTDRRDLKEVCFSIKDRKWKMTDQRLLKDSAAPAGNHLASSHMWPSLRHCSACPATVNNTVKQLHVTEWLTPFTQGSNLAWYHAAVWSNGTARDCLLKSQDWWLMHVYTSGIPFVRVFMFWKIRTKFVWGPFLPISNKSSYKLWVTKSRPLSDFSKPD